MKGFKKFFFDGLSFTVLIETLIFIIAAIAQPGVALPIGRYFLIMLFAFAISGTNYICSLLDLGRLAKLMIHYAVLMCAFLFVLMPAIGKSIDSGARAFAGIAIYTAFYFVFLGIGILAKRLLAEPEYTKGKKAKEDPKKKNGKSAKQNSNKNDVKSQQYTPRFK